MEKGKNTILVTGATGKQGGAVARYLLKNNYRVKIMTRKPAGEAAAILKSLGAEVIAGDYDEAKSLERALDGIWGVFAVQNTWEAGVVREEEQGKRFAEIAKKKGVYHFVYSSVGSAHRKTGIPHFDNKWRVEETVRSLKFPSYSILRPVFFMENFVSPWFLPGLGEGELRMGIKPETKVQMVAVDDIGKFGLLLFDRHEEMNGHALDIAGDERTMSETAELMSRAMDKKITFVKTPIEEVRKWSEDYALMLEWFDRVGYDVDIPALIKKYGIRPLTLDAWVKEAPLLTKKVA
jgi:uncharacterized protein YbjT (DUF2867 family)